VFSATFKSLVLPAGLPASPTLFLCGSHCGLILSASD
jgi:hypothetical protein